MKRIWIWALCGAVSGMAGAVTLPFQMGKDPVDYVNPKIGNISHMLVPTFPAIQLPNGMLRFLPPNESFLTDRIYGFSLQIPSHRHGGVMNLRPYSGDLSRIGSGWWTTYDHSDPRPYRYSVFLDNFDTTVALAPARRSAVMAFGFERDEPHALLLGGRGKAELRVEGRSVIGFDTFEGMKVYFYAEFDAPFSQVGVSQKDKVDFSRSSASGETLVLAFGETAERVSMRYAISYVSSEQAIKNLKGEITHFDLEKVAAAARKRWNATLGQIRVSGGTEDQKAVFYTALYRCYERMVKVSEDGMYYSCWDGKVHADDGVPFWTDDWTWDTYRATHPLMTLLRPTDQGQKLSSYVRMAQQSGWMPTFPTISQDAHCMNGQHAVSLFIDAWRKGVRTFDLTAAYEGMKKTMAEESMIPWFRGQATELDRFYWEKGYFPALKPGEKESVPQVNRGERRQSVAVTLAAAYDTWCMAQLATELGRTDDVATYLNHAYDYRNLWKKDTQFFHPKDAEGKWIEPLDYKYGGGQGARDYYDENNAWTYIWDVPHNIADLIACFGSPAAFNAKLDQLFNEGPGRARWEFYNVLPDSTGTVGMFVMGNEPSFHIPYLYNFSGEPWKTQKRVRMLLEAWFRNDLMGICGDEDGGGMSAFAVFSSMGFYPVTPGVPAYTFGSPIFKEISIALENGKTFVVKAPRASAENKYIQSVTVNGEPWDKTWFSHDVVLNGGTVEIKMGNRPNRSWGADPSMAPFSQGVK